MRQPALKSIPGYENYAVTATGRVWSKEREVYGRPGRSPYIRKGRWLKPSQKSTGYLAVGLQDDLFVTKYGKQMSNRTKYLHQLVALAWIGPPKKGQEVDHKDGNKHNNHYRNLQYLTHKENCKKYKKQPEM